MTIARVLLDGVVAGIVATTVKSKAEGALQPLAERVFPPTERAKARLGADPTDGGAMPPAQLVERVADAAEVPLDDEQQARGAMALHWSMGVGSAVLYSVVSQRWPRARTGGGALAGLVVFAASHASVLPALGLQAPLTKLPRAALLWEPGSHVAYGVAMDSVLRALR